MLSDHHHDSYASHCCRLDIGTPLYDRDGEGEGWPRKLADVNQPREAQHMADLAQMKDLEVYFLPVVLHSPQ